MSRGFSSSARQQTKASRPLGLRLRRILMNAAVGSAKNITPNREKAAWNEAGSNGICLDEPHSLAPFGRALRERQHRSRQIDPTYCAVRRDCLGKVQRSLTPATAHVQDALTR